MPDAGQRERGDGSVFLGKKKEPKKNRFCLSPDWVFLFAIWGYGFFIREAARMGGFDRLTRYESAAGAYSILFIIPRFVIWSVSGYRESGSLV